LVLLPFVNDRHNPIADGLDTSAGLWKKNLILLISAPIEKCGIECRESRGK